MAPRADPSEAPALLARLEAAQSALGRGDFSAGLQLAEALNEDALAIDAWRIAAEAALVVVAKIQCDRLIHDELERWCERAIATSRLLGTGHQETVAWVVLASSRAWGSQPGPALQAIDMALGHLQEDVPREVRRAVFTGIAMTYDPLGMPVPGLGAARQALTAVWPEDPVALRSRVRVNLLYSALSVAQWQASLAPGADLPLLQELTALDYDAHRSIKRNVWIALATVQRTLGEEPAAKLSLARAQVLEAAAGTAPAMGDLPWLAQLAELQGDWPQAVALLKRHHAMDMNKLLAAFDARVAELTAQVAQQSLRLENADLRQRNAGLTATFQRLRDLAHTDPLTQLANRRGLELMFDGLSRQGQRLTLAMLDFDHFKRINDRHSHVVGDEVLRRSAAAMQLLLREPDLLARYGGEEFTLLLVDSSAEAALHAVERLRQAVAGRDWCDLGLDQAVTLSAGIVEVLPDESLPSAVARADACLYKVKGAGRDRAFPSSTSQ